MQSNKFFKLLCSLPVILISLYFIPFLGVCLVLFRYYIYKNQKHYKISMYLVILGLVITIPKVINSLLSILKLKTNIPYLDKIIESDIYANLLEYSKLIICIGIIFLILSFIIINIINKLKNKLNNSVTNYIKETQKRDYEISKKNDMEIKIKQEKAKNTSYVKCPNCGSDNLLSEKFGTCKYCRRKIENKSFKA